MSRRRSRLPLEPVQLEVVGLSHDGRGIAHRDGKVIFIDGALPGEQVWFKYTAKHARFDEGQVTEVIEAAPSRVAPVCPHYGICGGCSLQHLAPQAQIEFKQAMLLELLAHQGGVVPQQILPPLTALSQGYRRKARLGIRYVTKKQKLLIGFREKNGRYLADIEHCAVLHPDLAKLLTPLAQLISTFPNYRDIPQVEVAMGDDECALIIRHMVDLAESDRQALTTFAQNFQVAIYLQPQGIDSIWKLAPNDGKELLSYQLADLTFYFHPSDFTQVNSEINRAMVPRALELLQPQASDSVLDLFCGLGNFSLPLAQQAGRVVGVEGDAAMVERAYVNARANGLSNCEFYAADLTQDLSQQPWAKQSFDKILLDPPRSGAFELLSYLPALGAHRIVYVSCNPATLARDTKKLVELGYTLQQAGVMDMFPHTSHVESIAVFVKERD